jgi:ribA/ribD-fused uncharacterized protein
MTEEEINFYLRKEKNGWCSNFWRAQQVVNHYVFDSNEHYYQSEKATTKEIEDWIAAAPNPFLAMMAGRSLRKGKELREDWEFVKLTIMHTGLLAKFSQNENLKQLLLDTGDAEIHEDSQTDMFWGKKGKDHLGKLLMHVRNELRKDEHKI